MLAIRNIWIADYWLDAGIKAVTALASLATAIMLWRLMPAALALPSRRQLAQANRELIEEVTRRREAEADLRKANTLLERRTTELEAANRELDSFAYSVSHDLRAPLRAITGFSQAMREDCGPALEDRRASFYLDQITTASERMAGLIDGLLLLSRCIRSELSVDTVDVSALAAMVRDGLDASEPTRAVSWQIDAGLTVTGDRRLVEVVLRNLLGNAWKYTRDTPAPVIRVFAGTVSGRAGICVCDNGAGFDMKYADQVFQPFQRLHRQDEFPGIGIGLATVKRIVDRHGGAISAEASVRHGALFRFALMPSDSHEEAAR